MARITKQTTFERITSVVCDRCNRRFEAGTPEFDAITHIDHHCGNASVWKNNAQIIADICEPCLRALIGDFCRVQFTGAARGLLADVDPQTECGEETSRDEALEHLRTSATHNQDSANPTGPESDWDSYFDQKNTPSKDFMADRDQSTSHPNGTLGTGDHSARPLDYQLEALKAELGVKNSDESDILRRAAIMLMDGDEAEAECWLNTPLKAFNHITPLEHSQIPNGSQEVLDLIGRILHGVSS